MKTYIALFRGINVGGHKKIKMAVLVSSFEKSGFNNIITYIQSGNVIFKADNQLTLEEIKNCVEDQIQKDFALEVEVLLRTPLELQDIVSRNPFKENCDMDKLFVTFLAQKPENSISCESSLSDQFVHVGNEVFGYCPNGFGKTKFSNTYFEKKLNVKATTRNWKTLNKLIELGQ